MNSEVVGRVNHYVCENNCPTIITRNRDNGLTPFMIRCTHCNETAKSQFYRVPQNPDKATHEWIAPTDVELLKYLNSIDKSQLTEKQWDFVERDTRRHVANNGLILVEKSDEQ